MEEEGIGSQKPSKKKFYNLLTVLNAADITAKMKIEN